MEYKQKKNLLFFLLAILIIFFISQFWLVGYITNDDVMLGNLSAINPGVNHFNNAFTFAKNQGRIQFVLITYFLGIAPYLFNNIFYYKLLSLGSVLVNLFLFGFLIKKMFKSDTVGILALALGLCFIQNSWEHNLLVAYPAVFTTSVSFLLLSFVCFIRYFETANSKYKYVSSLLFFLSAFTYELFILYLIFFVFLSFSYSKNKSSKSIKNIFPHIFLTIIYLVMFIAFRLVYQSNYEGNSVFNFSAMPMLKTWFKLSISFIPTYIYFHYQSLIQEYSYTYTGHINNILFIIKNSKVEWHIKSLISAYIAVTALKITNVRLCVRKFLVTFGIGILVVILPTFLHACLLKYQVWIIKYGNHLFTSSYFSYFGILFLIIVTLIFLKELVSESRKVFLIFLFSVGTLVYVLSLVIDYSNYHVTLSQSQNQMMWKMMDAFYDTSRFKELPNNSYIYSPSLWNNVLIDKTSNLDYWTTYTLYRTKKKITILQNLAQLRKIIYTNNEPIYYLEYLQDKKDPNQYFIFSTLNKKIFVENSTLTGNNLSLFSLSKYKQYQILYLKQDLIHSVIINNESNSNSFTLIQITDSDINLNSLIITYTINDFYSNLEK